MYEFEDRIRYSMTDEKLRLSLPSLLDFFQDAAIMQSDSLGIGLSYLAQRHRAWMMTAWQIQILRYPTHGEKITVGTFPYAFRGFLGYRNFIMKTENGETLVLANSIWAFVDVEANHAVSIPDEVGGVYELGEPLPMEYGKRKIAIPKDGKVAAVLPIGKEHLDSNGHVNNTQYVRLAMEVRQGTGDIVGMRAEYRNQARLGDRMQIQVFTDETAPEREVIVLAEVPEEGNPEPRVFAVVEFLTGE